MHSETIASHTVFNEYFIIIYVSVVKSVKVLMIVK